MSPSIASSADWGVPLQVSVVLWITELISGSLISGSSGSFISAGSSDSDAGGGPVVSVRKCHDVLFSMQSLVSHPSCSYNVFFSFSSKKKKAFLKINHR